MFDALPGDPGLPPGVTDRMIDQAAGPDVPPDDEAYCSTCGSPRPIEHDPDQRGNIFYARCARPGCRECC